MLGCVNTTAWPIAPWLTDIPPSPNDWLEVLCLQGAQEGMCFVARSCWLRSKALPSGQYISVPCTQPRIYLQVLSSLSWTLKHEPDALAKYLKSYALNLSAMP